MITRLQVFSQCGVTLVELLVSIVVVAVASSAVLGVMSLTAQGSADPMIRHQAAAIAESYLEEILLKPIADPDGIDGEVARVDFDDIDDYDGLSDAGARDQFGNPIASLAAYDVSVAVAASSGLTAAPPADVLRIDVNVARGTNINFTLSGYRLQY